MARFVSGCIVLLALAIPAGAQADDAFYHAVLKGGAAPATLVSSEVVWHGHDAVMEAGQAGDIAKRVCATLAQNVGAVGEFTAGGKALTTEELDACNKHARKPK